MRLIDCVDFKIVILETTNEDIESILGAYNLDHIIFVAMKGYEGDDLPIDRFLVKNHTAPFDNHLLWEGLLDSKEQEDYILDRCQRFWTTGTAMLIEDYEYQTDEPFYDYSK